MTDERVFDMFIRFGLPLFPFAIALLFLVFGHRPVEKPLPVSLAYGCYDSGDLRMLVDDAGIRTVMPGAKALRYHLVREKEWIGLQLEGNRHDIFRIETKLATPVLVDGIWVTDAANERLFERTGAERCG